jgi:hypothetical protein
MKSIAMSVRVSQDDAQFIAELDVPRASTPSDKLRSIIAEARDRHRGTRDYSRCLAVVQQMIHPSRQRVRETEYQKRVHSDLMAAVFDWLPETVAAVVTWPPADRDQQDAANLPELENMLADRVFRLIDITLRMGVTSECRCYDSQAVADRLGPVLELTRLIDAARRMNKEESR